MFRLLLFLILFPLLVLADTPPPGAVNIKGGTDGTKIGNSGDSLKVSITSGGGGGTVNQGSPNAGGVNAWYVQGLLGRTWNLSSGTDTVDVGNFPSAFGRTWSLSSGTDSVAISGSVSVSNFPSTYAVTQSTSPWVVSGSMSVSGTVNQGLAGPSPWLVDGSGVTQPISAASLPLPTGASTSANQSTIITVLGHLTDNTQKSQIVNSSGNPAAIQTLGTTPLSSDYGLLTNSLLYGLTTGGGGGYVPVKVNPSGALTADVTGTVSVSNFPATQAVTQSGTWNINNVSGTVSLPTGASTSANQTTANSSLSSIDGKIPSSLTVTSSRLLVDGSGVTQPISAASLPLPSGAATETSLAKLTQTQGSTTSGQSGPLVQAAVTADQPAYTTGQTSPLSLTTRGGLRTKSLGLETAQLIRNDYSTTNVTTAAYVQLVASTSIIINRLHIFDSSGRDFVLATGGAGSEVDQIQISPGGWDAPVDLYIPSGTRISIKAKSATASSGILLITGLK